MGAPFSRGIAPALAAGLTLVLAACSTTPPVTPPVPAPLPVSDVAGSSGSVASPPPDGPGPQTLAGWTAEDHLAAFEAYLTGCDVARDAAGRAQCRRAHELVSEGPVTSEPARIFFESGFTVAAAHTPNGDEGLLTSYFAPEYSARHAPDDSFDTPVLARPSDLERRDGGVVQRLPDGSTRLYPERSTIEAEVAVGQSAAPVLAWMRAEDLFFLQIQGSGYLDFGDGTEARAAYAADNGQRFVGIARPMAQQGLLPRNGTSGEAIRAWLAAHRGAEARAVTALNPRYIFFDLQPDDGGQPAGAAGVPLTARRAIAVDPASWKYGDLVWIEADDGNLAGARASYRGLVMALDTGSAIRGPVRADFYMGRGAAAGEEAGSVRHPLRMWRLIPRPMP